MRAAFGKVNTLHNHVLPWVDRPLVTQNLVGGEDGIDDAGLSLSRILPAPKGIFMEGTAQVFRGDTENVFRAQQAQRPLDRRAPAHLSATSPINTNIDLGGSWSRGRSPFGDGWNQLYGFDATLRWKPLPRSIYHSFVARTELIWARTVSAPRFGPASPGDAQSRTPFGMYASGDYQLGRRWFLGGRFDRSQRVCGLPTNPETTTTCAIPCSTESSLCCRTPAARSSLTYWPSEFSQIRGQLRRTRYGEGLTANEFLFQFMFSMGAHGAHPF